MPSAPAGPEHARDLVVEVDWDPGSWRFDERPRARLVNTSTQWSYDVVRSGDGSSRGRREPHLFWTTETSIAGGPWELVESTGLRCSHFDGDWKRQVVTLAPGEFLELDFVGLPDVMAFEDPGRTRCWLTYDYRGTRHVDPGPYNGLTGHEVPDPRVSGIPAFNVRSATIEHEHDPGLRVELDVLGPVPRNAWFRWSDVLDVRVHNLTDEPIRIPHAPPGFEYGLRCWTDARLIRRKAPAEEDAEGAPVLVPALGTVSLLDAKVAMYDDRPMRLQRPAESIEVYAKLRVPGAPQTQYGPWTRSAAVRINVR